MLQSFQAIKSLGFGAMLGAGILGLVRVFFPQLILGDVSLAYTILVGALLGAGAHRLIESLFGGFVTPLLRAISFYAKLTQIVVLRELRIIGEKQKKQLIEALTNAYFQESR